MALGIKAFVDFVFKKIFGSPENSVALIGLLNAILELQRPISEVTILNPFSYQEFETAKLVVLDVKAKDSAGRIFNIEMQISIHPGLLQRMMYYASEMYTDQLSEGDDYTQLNTTISICLLTGNLFPDSGQAHHRFEMKTFGDCFPIWHFNGQSVALKQSLQRQRTKRCTINAKKPNEITIGCCRVLESKGLSRALKEVVKKAP
ncbi:MAG: Rpn family recombination-promoting nuclease/putative transposase [Planctomycetaceae bacterium]